MLDVIFLLVAALFSIVFSRVTRVLGFRLIFMLVGGMFLMLLATLMTEPVVMVALGIFGGVVMLIGASEVYANL